MPLVGKTIFFFMLSHVQNALLFRHTNTHTHKRTIISLKGAERPREEMAPRQVHDIHYWLDYNERRGNNSRWCLCAGDFKPWDNAPLTR